MNAALLLLAGLVVLAFAGNLLVQGASTLARRMSLPDFLIGLTVVAFGTSAPELVVAIRSALAGEPVLALGAVIGSNIANILLVLGIPSLIATTRIEQPFVRRNYIFLLAVTAMFVGFCLTGRITFQMGAILFATLFAFLGLSIYRARDMAHEATLIDAANGTSRNPGAPDLGIGKTVFFIVLGIVGLPLGAEFTVNGALGVAEAFALPKEGVGLVFLALGTSLPELAAGIAAAWRRESGLILGGVIGSNIFNLLSIMGITAMLAELDVAHHIQVFDIWIMLGTTLLLGMFVLRRADINKPIALLFIALYIVFVYLAFVPGAGTA